MLGTLGETQHALNVGTNMLYKYVQFTSIYYKLQV